MAEKESIVKEDVVIPYTSKEIPGKLFRSKDATTNSCGIILTHGAGGDMHNKHLVELASFLCDRGHDVLCFTCKGLNIVYRAKVFGCVVEYFCSTYKPETLIIGGRSMGARAAAMVADPTTQFCDKASADKIKGIICLAFPLHPKGQETSLRDENLLKITQKEVFFLSGTKDELCQQNIMERMLERLTCAWKIEWMPGCDHSFAVKGKPAKELYSSACIKIGKWIEKVTVD